jgi:hypothetical protein
MCTVYGSLKKVAMVVQSKGAETSGLKSVLKALAEGLRDNTTPPRMVISGALQHAAKQKSQQI